MIIVQLVWKAQFLSGFYFRQDDIHFTELALHSSLNWKYLSYVGSGHLHPGVLFIVWIMARAAVYSWGAASAVTIVMLAIASVAAWWLLRTLIGNRPAILIPLALYLVTPLTFPNDSWWQSGIESLPLQAVIFLSLASHVSYVRTGRARHLAAAAVWLAVGMVFFEKAAVIPVLLFCVTAGFLVERRRLVVSIRTSLLRYWRAWAVYVAMVAVYAVLLIDALAKSSAHPKPPTLSTSLTFSGDLIKDSLLPGLVGGPWHWVLLTSPGTNQPDQAVAYAAPGTALIWLAAVAVLVIIVASALTRPRAWRAWAMLAIWVLAADIVPVLLGRLAGHTAFGALLAMDTRYVSDAAPVAAICVALAFWPVARTVGEQQEQPAHGGQPEYFAGQRWRLAGIGLTVVVVIGSVVSVQTYESKTSQMNSEGRAFWANAKTSLAQPRPRSVIYDQHVPQIVMLGIYKHDALDSAVLAPLISKSAARDIRWTTHPSGTNLLLFANDGTLRPAWVAGIQGTPPSGPTGCWPDRKGRIVVRFPTSEPQTFSGELRIPYVAGAAADGEDVTVSYAGEHQQFVVQGNKLNAVYFPVHGSASSVTLTLSDNSYVCVGPTQVGYLVAP